MLCVDRGDSDGYCSEYDDSESEDTGYYSDVVSMQRKSFKTQWQRHIILKKIKEY